MTRTAPEQQQELRQERYALLARLEGWLETPMLVLAFAWLALVVAELTWGESQLFEVFGTLIWGVFILDFVVKIVLAPDKGDYLRGNWLTALSLLLPALRVVRVVRLVQVFRLASVGRGLRLIRVLGSLNRGMKALGASLGRRGFGYVLALTLLVTFAGAAGMYAFERDQPDGRGLNDYGSALWWTAMIMTTMGSGYWPRSAEGRVLCWFLSLYAFAVFGYVTAALATFFVGRDADADEAEVAGAKSIAALQSEVAALRDDIRALGRRWPEA